MIATASQSGVRVKIDLSEALVQPRQSETMIPGTHPSKKGAMTGERHSIVEVAILIHASGSDLMCPLGLVLTLN